MTRKEFVTLCKIFGLGSPFLISVSSCSEDDVVTPEFGGKVIIIGAGAGGLSSGHLLQQKGVDFEILEASSRYGGRMRINTEFADFPIPLGAEWLETDTGIFQEIVNDSSVQVDVDTVPDAPRSQVRKFLLVQFFRVLHRSFHFKQNCLQRHRAIDRLLW